MTEFETLGLKAGQWLGLLRRNEAPARVVLVHMGQPVGEATVRPDGEGVWRIEAMLPANTLSDGVQTYALLGDEGGDEMPGPDSEWLGQLSLVAGAPLQMDLRAEIDLIRAELDLLKREFRRLAML
ncbi:MAG: hypothetical protein ACK5LJ_12940 [Paracoccus sp. (in: a-proteobacteria)]